MRLLLFSALPSELGRLAHLLGRKERLRGLPFDACRLSHPLHAVTSVETGIGIERAAAVFHQALDAAGPFDAVISLGYCGSLSPEAAVGDLVYASRVCLVEGRTLRSLPLPDERGWARQLSSRLPLRAGTFLTLSGWMQKKELRGLVPADLPIPVCEMETFALARLSTDARLPFLAVRAVSDASGEEVPFDPREVCDRAGRYRTSKALRFFLFHPHLLRNAARLRRGSEAASRSLAAAVCALLRILS